MVGKFVKESKAINNNFKCEFINLSTSLTVNQIGKMPLLKITKYLKIIFYILKCIILKKPDLVYLTPTAKGIGFYKDFPIVVLLKLFKNSLVLHFHNKGVLERQNKIIDNFMYRFLFKNVNVILLSKILYKDISKYANKKNVFFLANGIPNSINIQNQSKFKNKVIKLIFLSNLIESKGIYILLNSLNILKKKGLLFQCNIVGREGDVKIQNLNDKIIENDLFDEVKYLGSKYGVEKYEILKNSDIFVFPSYYHNECFPIVLLEAMQFGLPVISTNEGAISDIIDNNKTGFIIDKKNPNLLAEKIEWFIENPESIYKMGKNARNKFLKRYTTSSFENSMLKIFNTILVN